MIFNKKKLYKIKYSHLSTYETIIAARSPAGALRKFYRMHTTMWRIHSIVEYSLNRGDSNDS